MKLLQGLIYYLRLAVGYSPTVTQRRSSETGPGGCGREGAKSFLVTPCGGIPGRQKGSGTQRPFSFSSMSNEGYGTWWGVSLGFGGNTNRKDLCGLRLQSGFFICQISGGLIFKVLSCTNITRDQSLWAHSPAPPPQSMQAGGTPCQAVLQSPPHMISP